MNRKKSWSSIFNILPDVLFIWKKFTFYEKKMWHSEIRQFLFILKERVMIFFFIIYLLTWKFVKSVQKSEFYDINSVVCEIWDFMMPGNLTT